MAKRRKKTAITRRRRVSGMPKVGDKLTDALTILAGTVVVGIVNKKFLANKSPMIKAGVPILAGILLPSVTKGNKMIQNISTGLIIGGGMQLMQKFGLAGLAGDDDMIAIPLQMSGDGLNLLAGADDEFDMQMSGNDSTDALNTLAGILDDED